MRPGRWRWGAALLAAGIVAAADRAAADGLDRQAVEAAAVTDKAAADGKSGEGKSGRPDPLTLKAQVLLDRAGFSPGAIDGRQGGNLRGAIAGFAEANGLKGERLDRALWDKLAATGTGPVLADYTLTEQDVAGPFAEVPARMEEQADLKALSYADPAEMLAERFHMSRALLEALNPGKPLDKAGTVIVVAAVPAMGTGRPKAKELPETPKVARITVDKAAGQVRAYGEDGALLRLYPASVGSREKPAPSGTFKVQAVAFDPDYTYNPDYAFQGVKTRKAFTIKPGPNNPVGVVWIDLSAESYGIHGTPEPEEVGKAESHGCVRLTNWDARDLALHVAKGATVEFTGSD
ncbi:L,D-transpeptidase [uncultured Methylobacterium sp.]|jgi:lipoprotein-anchoring transpeptidase ErfK/SrfK|uniref:L,D-transpeptidase family protein n=1 Tax=uncultured Methylobacterium sp. TaxID=157278 RepID=UPI0026268B9E|nr:L,D-transpeptidase [uncultured Methylobacterium sp.]